MSLFWNLLGYFLLGIGSVLPGVSLTLITTVATTTTFSFYAFTILPLYRKF